MPMITPRSKILSVFILSLSDESEILKSSRATRRENDRSENSRLEFLQKKKDDSKINTVTRTMNKYEYVCGLARLILRCNRL